MRYSTFSWLVLIYLAVACSSAMAAQIQLPATGQTSCFDTFGNLIPCAGTGQDADKLQGVAWPTPRFTDNANGTVTDNLTGLVWLKEASCLSFLDWTTALGSARSLASGACGLTDGSKAGEWRLPNILELESLVDISRTAPALPANHPFVNVIPGLYFSSTALSTPYVFARGVDMNDGRLAGVGIRDGFALAWPVRNAASVVALPRTGQTVCTTPSTTDVGSSDTIACTNTGQDGETLSGVPWPTPRFSDNNDGTMTDNLTGLVWLKKTDCFDLQTWQQALDSSNNLASGLCGLNDASKAGSWRLPNRKEMLSLANYNTEFQTFNWLNTQGFINAIVNLYWSSDTYIPLPTLKWSVTPQGHAFSLDSNAMAWLLPVRDPIPLSSVAINCGGQTYTDSTGVTYQSDKYFSGGYMNSTTSSISGTMDGIVYQNWRYGNFSYHFPLVSGTYSVTLKFADWDCTAGQRLFDVNMEGSTVLNDFDIYAQAGRLNAYDVTIPVSVSDGALDIDFISTIDTAKINAILVKPISNPEIFTISASAGTGGNITPSGTTSILSGGSKSFAITPNVGSVIADVTVDGVSIGPRSSYTFSKVSSNHTIQASFASNVVKSIFAISRGDTSYIDSSNHAYLADTRYSGGSRKATTAPFSRATGQR